MNANGIAIQSTGDPIEDAEEEGSSQYLSATDYLIANVPKRTAKTFLAATLILCELADNRDFRSGSVRLEGNKLAVEIKMRRRGRRGEKRYE